MKSCNTNFNKYRLILSIFFGMIFLVNSSSDPNFEWTDPESGTYYNIASLKKDPK